MYIVFKLKQHTQMTEKEKKRERIFTIPWSERKEWVLQRVEAPRPKGEAKPDPKKKPNSPTNVENPFETWLTDDDDDGESLKVEEEEDWNDDADDEFGDDDDDDENREPSLEELLERSKLAELNGNSDELSQMFADMRWVLNALGTTKSEIKKLFKTKELAKTGLDIDILFAGRNKINSSISDKQRIKNVLQEIFR